MVAATVNKLARALFLAAFLAASQASGISPAGKPSGDADWTRFLSALAQVETRGKNHVKVLDTNGKHSRGCLQIQAAYLADSRTGYSLEDLYDRDVSFTVARKYLERWGRSYEKRTGKPATFEVLARIHNGGPRGAEKEATEKYWEKVKAELEKR